MTELRTDEVEIAGAILASHRNRVGGELIEPTGDPVADAVALRRSPIVVLSHDGGADPRFVYANDAAARLWATTVDHLIGMPSRLSAAEAHREARATALAGAARDGVHRGYTGERRAMDGTRFSIIDAVLWTVDFVSGPGQAAAFAEWELFDPLS